MARLLLLVNIYAGCLGVARSFVQTPTIALRQASSRGFTCNDWKMTATSERSDTSNSAQDNDKYFLTRARALLKKDASLKGNLIRVLCNPSSEHFDKELADKWNALPKSRRKIILQKHEQQVITFGLDPFRTAAIKPKEDTQPGEAQDKNASTERIKKGSTPPPNVGAQAPPPSSSKEEKPSSGVWDIASAFSFLKSKPKAQVASEFDKAREEQNEIARIKNDFMAKLEVAGRQSTIRLKTAGEMGLAAYQQGAKKADNLPEEVFIKSPQ